MYDSVVVDEMTDDTLKYVTCVELIRLVEFGVTFCHRCHLISTIVLIINSNCVYLYDSIELHYTLKHIIIIIIHNNMIHHNITIQIYTTYPTIHKSNQLYMLVEIGWSDWIAWAAKLFVDLHTFTKLYNTTFHISHEKLDIVFMAIATYCNNYLITCIVS